MSGNSTGWDETPFYSQLKQALGVDDWPDVQLIVSHFIDKMHSCLKGEATFFSPVNTAETVSGCLEIEKYPLKNRLHPCWQFNKFHVYLYILRHFECKVVFALDLFLLSQEVTKTYSECSAQDLSPKTSDIDPELINVA